MARGKRSQASSYHHGDLRQAAVEATRALVHEQGLEGLTLRRVASQVGVSAPALLHHFPTKTHLVAAAVGAAFERLDGLLARAAQGPGSAAEHLEAMGVAYVRFAMREPGDFRLTFGSHVSALRLVEHECVRVPGRRAKARFRTAVCDALGAVGSSADPEAAFAVVWGQVVGIASLLNEDELGPGPSAKRAEMLTRAAIQSHLRGGFA